MAERADARRNRERLLASAAAAFAAADGPVSLEAIARDAGVGIGTLYRHFRTGRPSSRPCTPPNSQKWRRRPSSCWTGTRR